MDQLCKIAKKKGGQVIYKKRIVHVKKQYLLKRAKKAMEGSCNNNTQIESSKYCTDQTTYLSLIG